jgi:hypothetical protein
VINSKGNNNNIGNNMFRMMNGLSNVDLGGETEIDNNTIDLEYSGQEEKDEYWHKSRQKAMLDYSS